jgi:hypothetical protein
MCAALRSSAVWPLASLGATKGRYGRITRSRRMRCGPRPQAMIGAGVASRRDARGRLDGLNRGAPVYAISLLAAFRAATL